MLARLKHEFVYGGHLLSLGAASIVWSVAILSNTPTPWISMLLAYLASQIVYNYDHLSDLGGNKERAKHLTDTKNFQYLLLSFYVSLFVLSSMLSNISASALAVIIVFGGVLYTKKAKYFTRRILGFKNIYISLFWSALTFFVPLQFSLYPFSMVFVSIFLFIFIRWIINSVYFDIKDFDEDRIKNLKTFPVSFGLSRTVSLLHVLNILSGLVVTYMIYRQILPGFSLVLLAFPFYSFYYLNRTEKLSGKKLRIISYVMVDGEYFLWPFALLIGKLILK